MFNLSCIIRIPEHEIDEGAAASWNASADKNTMIDHFAGFGEQMRSILRYLPLDIFLLGAIY